MDFRACEMLRAAETNPLVRPTRLAGDVAPLALRNAPEAHRWA